VLGAPGVGALLAASIVARLPLGISGLAIVLYLSDARGSFGVAGLASGAMAAGSAIGSPLQSRTMDRLGQRAVLVPLAFGYAAAIAALVVCTELGGPVAAIATCGLAAGACQPGVSSAMRTLWPTLLHDRTPLLPTAFAVDSITIEVVFTAGPLLTALTVALLSPLVALAAATAFCVGGTVAFCARPPSRAWRPAPFAGPRSRLGALRSGGVRTLMVCVLPLGFCFGSIEIALPAFAKAHGAPAWAGVLLAMWSVASAAGGIVYGARTWESPLQRIFLVLSLLLPVAFLPLLLAPGVALMLLLVIPAGLLIAPLLATGNQLVGLVAPPDALTEAYAWPTTALVVGIAAGAAVAGAVVEATDWRSALICSTAAGVVGGFAAVTRRATLAGHLIPARASAVPWEG
jgi:MFS family permease